MTIKELIKGLFSLFMGFFSPVVCVYVIYDAFRYGLFEYGILRWMIIIWIVYMSFVATKEFAKEILEEFNNRD